MKKTRSRLLLTGAVLLMCTLLAGCGCGKKKAADPETEEVIKISITPEPTPTTAPEQVNSAAVVSSGGVTMVNSYLDENAGTMAILQHQTCQYSKWSCGCVRQYYVR